MGVTKMEVTKMEVAHMLMEVAIHHNIKMEDAMHMVHMHQF